jgi:hypothetical protein
MKVYKWKKSDVDPVKLLRRVDAVTDNQGHPYFVYISPKRYNEMKRYIYKLVREEIPQATKKRIAYTAELHLVNFSPVILKGLPDDIVLVDDKAIKNQCTIDNINEKR